MEAEVVASTFTLPRQMSVEDPAFTAQAGDEILQPNRASMDLLLHTDTATMSRIRTVSECHLDDVSFVDASGSVLDQMLANEEMMSANDPWVMPSLGEILPAENATVYTNAHAPNVQNQFPGNVVSNNNKVSLLASRCLPKQSVLSSENSAAVSAVNTTASATVPRLRVGAQGAQGVALDALTSLAPTPPPSSASSSSQSLTEDDFNVLHLDDSSVAALDSLPLFSIDGDMGSLLDQFEDVSSQGDGGEEDVVTYDGRSRPGVGAVDQSESCPTQNGQLCGISVRAPPGPVARSNSAESPEVVRLLQAKRPPTLAKHGGVAALSGTTPPPTPPPGVINKIKKTAASQRKTAILVEPQPRAGRGRREERQARREERQARGEERQAPKAQQTSVVFTSKRLRRLLGHTADSGSDSDRTALPKGAGVRAVNYVLGAERGKEGFQKDSAFARITSAIEDEVKYPGTPETITAPSTPAQPDSLTAPSTPAPHSGQNSRCSTPESSSLNSKKKISLSTYISTRLVGTSVNKKTSSGSTTPISGRGSPVKEFEDNTQLIMDTVRAKLNAQINANRLSTAKSQQSRPVSYCDVLLDHDYCQRQLSKPAQPLHLPLSISKSTPTLGSAQNSPSKNTSGVSSCNNSPQNSPHNARKEVRQERNGSGHYSKHHPREKPSRGQEYTHHHSASRRNSERRGTGEGKVNSTPHRDQRQFQVTKPCPAAQPPIPHPPGHLNRHASAPTISHVPWASYPSPFDPAHGVPNESQRHPAGEESATDASKSQNLKDLLLNPGLEEEVKAQAVVDREECMRRMSGEHDDKSSDDRHIIDMELDSDMETEYCNLLGGNSINMPESVVIPGGTFSNAVSTFGDVSEKQCIDSRQVTSDQSYSCDVNQLQMRVNTHVDEMLEQLGEPVEKQPASSANPPNEIACIKSEQNTVLKYVPGNSELESAQSGVEIKEERVEGAVCCVSGPTNAVKRGVSSDENEFVISVKRSGDQKCIDSSSCDALDTGRKHAPGAPTDTPQVPTHTPAAATHTPQVPTHTPVAATHPPAAPIHTPAAATHPPAAPIHTPVAATHTPAAPIHTTAPPAHTPTVSTDTPLASEHTALESAFGPQKITPEQLSSEKEHQEKNYVEMPLVKNKRDPLNLMLDSQTHSDDLKRNLCKGEKKQDCNDKFKQTRAHARGRKNFRKRHESLPKSQSEPTFDKLPSYCTALSIPTKAGVGRGIPGSKLIDRSLPTRDRDPSPDRSDPVFNKVPAYFSCFTNSTKYDTDNQEDPLRIDDDERGAVSAQEVPLWVSTSASEESSSKYDLDIDCGTPDLVICSQPNSNPASRGQSRTNSRAPSRVGSRANSSSRTHSRSRRVSRSPYRSRSRSRSPSDTRSRRSTRGRKRSYSSSSRSSSRSRSYSSRSHSRSCSRSRSYSRSRSRSRSASRFNRFHSERGRPGRKRRRYSRSRSRSASWERWRDQQRSKRGKEKEKQMEQRRIVYIGGIGDSCSRAELREAFTTFGDIEEVNVHFREHGDNYGFITFAYACDAYAAIERGNKLKGCEKYDLCFGGRRHFCKSEYADLDGNMEDEEEMASVMPIKKQSSEPDFDELLRQALKKSKKKTLKTSRH